MRPVLSLLLALVAGLLAVAAGVGALVDEAAHRPDLVRQVATSVATDAQVRAAIPGAVTDSVESAVPTQVPAPLTQWVEDLVRPIAQSVAQDPQVAQGFADTADAARRAWLLDLDQARRDGAHGPAGDVAVPFGPVAQSGVASALGDVETRLRSDQLNVPGQTIVEALIGKDLGDWAAETVIRPLYDRAAALRDDTALTLNVHVDALQGVDRVSLARLVAASAHWVWAAVAAGIVLLLALLAAPLRWRGPVIALAAVVTLLGSWALASATRAQGFAVGAPEGASPGVAALAREVDRAVGPALGAALHPYAAALATAGWIALAAAVLVALAEWAVARSRRRHARYHGAHVRRAA